MLESNLKKHLKKLQQKKYRKEFREFVVEGIKGVEEALESQADILALIVDGKRREEKSIAIIIAQAENQDIGVAYAGRKDIPVIKTTETFPGVMAIVSMPETSMDTIGKGPVVCLDAVNDPGNLGTIIRTADWFGVKSIILGEGSVDVYNPKVVRSTMGSLFHVNTLRTDNLARTIEKLKGEGYSTAALDLEGEKIEDLRIKIEDNVLLIFGSESHGLRLEIKKLCDETYTIHKHGKAESLNLGVAVGITLSKLS